MATVLFWPKHILARFVAIPQSIRTITNVTCASTQDSCSDAICVKSSLTAVTICRNMSGKSMALPKQRLWWGRWAVRSEMDRHENGSELDQGSVVLKQGAVVQHLDPWGRTRAVWLLINSWALVRVVHIALTWGWCWGHKGCWYSWCGGENWHTPELVMGADSKSDFRWTAELLERLLMCEVSGVLTVCQYTSIDSLSSLLICCLSCMLRTRFSNIMGHFKWHWRIWVACYGEDAQLYACLIHIYCKVLLSSQRNVKQIYFWLNSDPVHAFQLLN